MDSLTKFHRGTRTRSDRIQLSQTRTFWPEHKTSVNLIKFLLHCDGPDKALNPLTFLLNTLLTQIEKFPKKLNPQQENPSG